MSKVLQMVLLRMFVCVCVDAEVGGQLCIGHGVSGLRQASMLSTMGRTWLAEVWRQTDIMDQRCWQELKTVAKERGLEALSEHAESLVMDTHAAATVRTYEGAYGRWREWADSHNFQALPADPVAVSLYPVHVLIETAGLESEDFLFSNLVKKKDKSTKKKGSLNYTHARELLREAVGKAGLDPTEYGLHSLRSGGTTAAAAAKGHQRLLKRQGGWRSEAVNVYIQETLDNLLAPSEAASW